MKSKLNLFTIIGFFTFVTGIIIAFLAMVKSLNDVFEGLSFESWLNNDSDEEYSSDIAEPWEFEEK